MKRKKSVIDLTTDSIDLTTDAIIDLTSEHPESSSKSITYFSDDELYAKTLYQEEIEAATSSSTRISKKRFKELDTVITKQYQSSHPDKSCPICLVLYKKGDSMKALPCCKFFF
jgi:hypothetical protein